MQLSGRFVNGKFGRETGSWTVISVLLLGQRDGVSRSVIMGFSRSQQDEGRSTFKHALGEGINLQRAITMVFRRGAADICNRRCEKTSAYGPEGEETDRWLNFGDQLEIVRLSGFISRD